MRRGKNHRVTITVDERTGDTLKRILILADALRRVAQGSKLIRVESADFIAGCIIILLEGPPDCGRIDAAVHVDFEPVAS